jgi:hypothetical protein
VERIVSYVLPFEKIKGFVNEKLNNFAFLSYFLEKKEKKNTF